MDPGHFCTNGRSLKHELNNVFDLWTSIKYFVDLTGEVASLRFQQVVEDNILLNGKLQLGMAAFQHREDGHDCLRCNGKGHTGVENDHLQFFGLNSSFDALEDFWFIEPQK